MFEAIGIMTPQDKATVFYVLLWVTLGIASVYIATVKPKSVPPRQES